MAQTHRVWVTQSQEAENVIYQYQSTSHTITVNNIISRVLLAIKPHSRLLVAGQLRRDASEPSLL